MLSHFRAACAAANGDGAGSLRTLRQFMDVPLWFEDQHRGDADPPKGDSAADEGAQRSGARVELEEVERAPLAGHDAERRPRHPPRRARGGGCGSAAR